MNYGYECLLPTTNQKVFVRGLTLKEELELQKSVFITTQSVLEKTLKLAQIAQRCVLTDISFDDFLNNSTDYDLSAILFGVIYTTFGKDLKITFTCPETKKEGFLAVDLDRAIASGNINTDSTLELNENQISIKIGTTSETLTIINAPYNMLVDQISSLAYLQKMGINTLTNLTPTAVEKIGALKKIRSVRSYKLNTENTFHTRPPIKDQSKLVQWYDYLMKLISDTPSIELKVIQPLDSPYNLSFNVSGKCAQCQNIHETEFDCLRYIMELTAS